MLKMRCSCGTYQKLIFECKFCGMTRDANEVVPPTYPNPFLILAGMNERSVTTKNVSYQTVHVQDFMGGNRWSIDNCPQCGIRTSDIIEKKEEFISYVVRKASKQINLNKLPENDKKELWIAAKRLVEDNLVTTYNI